MRYPESDRYPLQKSSENILVVDVQNEPQFSDDLNALFDTPEQGKKMDVALSFANVTYVNSSNIAKMLKLRKLVLCGVNAHISGSASQWRVVPASDTTFC